MHRLVAILAAAWIAGCSVLRSAPPTISEDPSPGYVRIVAVPPQSPIPLRIWFRDPGFPDNLSTVRFDFAAGQRLLIVFPSTPGDNNGALQVNTFACRGGWSITSNVETDVLLHLDDAGCTVEVVGSHVFGEVHTDPQTEAQLDPVT